MNSRKSSYILMTALVCLWGMEYIVAKRALEALAPLTLVFFKYFVGFLVLACVKLAVNRRVRLRRKDLAPLALCVVFGDIIYYFAEYQALSYLSVAIVTILLSFVPLLSIGIERVFFGKRPSAGMLAGVFVCILGIALIIGIDFSQFRGGKVVGYALAGIAVVSWNIYNFFTKELTAAYTSLDLTLYQLVCTLLILAPYAVFHLPAPESLSLPVVAGTVYLGVFSSAVGFLIYVRAISIIGPTPCALFSTFMPVTAAFFGWLILGETLTALQIAGGVLVVVSACFVISQKDRRDLLYAAEGGGHA